MASCTNATRAAPGATFERTASTRGVLRPAETARHADLQRHDAVAPELQPFVERYWSVRWDRTGQPAFRSEVLSHPCVNVSVESGTHPRFGFSMPAALVHGPVTRRFSVDLTGAGRVTAVKFRPGGFTAFTRARPAPDSVAELRTELGPPATQLMRAVLDERDDEGRTAALDASLVAYATEPAPAYLELLDLLGQMLHDRGLTRVDQVAARGELSVRALQRTFATYVGISPKAVLARYRLQDAVAAIDAGDAGDLAGLAASLGWCDQAHFSRDFRAVVGTTPSAYLSRAHQASESRYR